MAEISTKPYLIRALYEWCSDNGYRPYIAVAVDERALVPREFVRNGEIVLNISAAATNGLSIGNELLEFEARFSGVARQVSIPIENISAIFAQENGHGMAFEVPKAPAPETEGAGVDEAAAPDGASSPSDDEAPGEADAPAASAQARSRKRPKLAAVPATADVAPKPARRKAKISAVPTPAGDSGLAAGSGGPASEGGAPAAAPDDGSGNDDGPGPAAPPPGRPHLTRVK